jgi:hypothetical protein
MNLPPPLPTSLQKEFNVAIKMKNWNHRGLREGRRALVIYMDDDDDDDERERTQFRCRHQKRILFPLKNNEVATLFIILCLCVMLHKNRQKYLEVKCYEMVQIVIQKKRTHSTP